MTARATWTGSLSFGLVNIPVGVYAATEDRSVHFNQFRAGDKPERIRMKRVGEITGEEVEYSGIVKGYDLGGGAFVLITPEELAAVQPVKTNTIEVTDFVNLSEIDPIYFDKPYFLAPYGKGTPRAYELMRAALEATGRAAIATFVMRDKQHLVAIRAQGSVLVLSTLNFADEIRTANDIKTIPTRAEFTDAEFEMAKALVEAKVTTWKPEAYRDEYRERVEALIDQKAKGVEIDTTPTEEPVVGVTDLLASLQASVAAIKARAA